MPNNRPIHPPNLDANITYGVVPPQSHIHRQMRTNENMLHNPRIDNNNNQQTLQIYPNNDYYASSKIDRKNLKHFSGKNGEDVESWIFLLERFFEKSRIAECQKIDIAVDHLQNGALAAYRNLRQLNNEEINWNQLKEVLLDEFQPFDMEVATEEKLRQLRQKGNKKESLIKYINSNKMIIKGSP
jgi:hypothetical protein